MDANKSWPSLSYLHTARQCQGQECTQRQSIGTWGKASRAGIGDRMQISNASEFCNWSRTLHLRSTDQYGSMLTTGISVKGRWKCSSIDGICCCKEITPLNGGRHGVARRILTLYQQCTRVTRTTKILGKRITCARQSSYILVLAPGNMSKGTYWYLRERLAGWWLSRAGLKTWASASATLLSAGDPLGEVWQSVMALAPLA